MARACSGRSRVPVLLSPFLEAVRSAYAVYEAACFSAGVYTHFPFLAPSQPARSTTHPTHPPMLHLRHLRLSPPPAPKEIKPHLSALIIVVTYSPRVVSPRAVRETSLARRKNPAEAEWQKARRKEAEEERTGGRCAPARFSSSGRNDFAKKERRIFLGTRVKLEIEKERIDSILSSSSFYFVSSFSVDLQPLPRFDSSIRLD